MAHWRHAPLGTPLWERLPRDLQEHIARFLAQKMLDQFCMLDLQPRALRIACLYPTEEGHLAQLDSMMQATPVFDRALYAVYLLSVPVQRWQHHHAFANGLNYHLVFQIQYCGVGKRGDRSNGNYIIA